MLLQPRYKKKYSFKSVWKKKIGIFAAVNYHKITCLSVHHALAIEYGPRRRSNILDIYVE